MPRANEESWRDVKRRAMDLSERTSKLIMLDRSKEEEIPKEMVAAAKS